MSQDPNNVIHSPEQTVVQRRYYEGEIELREIFMVLWLGKFWVTGAALIAAVVSVVVVLWLPNIYRSDALIAADEEGNGGLASLAAQYGGLASLAGISLPTDGSSEVAIGIETLKSREFITGFIERRDILPDLMAAKSYSIETGEITYNARIYIPETQTWTREVRPPYVPKPSLQEAYKEFLEIFGVSENTETGFYTISVEHRSPILAERWVRWLVEDINEKMMTDAMTEAQESINFLSEQIANTHVAALQDVFYSLVEEQTKTIMLANARPEYLFKTLDSAIVPEKKVKPFRALICILGTALGGFLGILIVLVRQYLRNAKPSI